MENEKIERDYDKDPIIIEDYNLLFSALFTLYGVPIVIYLYIFNPGELDETSLSTNIFIVMPILMVPYIYPYFKNKSKRKIIIKNDYISFNHEEIEIEKIKIKEITDIRISFTDLYHKSQHPSKLGRIFSYITFPIAIIMNLILIINKYFFHIFQDGEESYRFFDAYIIFSEKRFINILPTTREEYSAIEKYFHKKNILTTKEVKRYYYLFGAMPEKINLEGR
jgi:hypothetical protein